MKEHWTPERTLDKLPFSMRNWSKELRQKDDEGTHDPDLWFWKWKVLHIIDNHLWKIIKLCKKTKWLRRLILSSKGLHNT